MSEWDKLVSDLEHVPESEATLSVDQWFDQHGRPDNTHEKMLRMEVELMEFGRTLNRVQRQIAGLDASDVVTRLDESNSRLNSIQNAIAIQGPTFGYLLFAAGVAIGIFGTIKCLL